MSATDAVYQASHPNPIGSFAGNPPNPVALEPDVQPALEGLIDTAAIIGHSDPPDPVTLVTVVSFPTEKTEYPASNKLRINCAALLAALNP